MTSSGAATMPAPAAPTALLAVSPLHLMHTAVAYNTPALLTLDLAIARPGPSPALPVELLLTVRAHLLPALVADVRARAAAALTAYERALPDRLCTECREYNMQVFGAAVWEWPDFCRGCDCERVGAARALASTPAPAPAPPLAPTTPAPEPRNTKKDTRWARARVFASPAAWTEGYLSAQCPADTSVWHAAEAMLAEHGCTVARLPPSPHDATTLEQPAHVAPVAALAATAGAVALDRARRELGLDAEKPPSAAPPPVAPFTVPAALPADDKPSSYSRSAAPRGCIGTPALPVPLALPLSAHTAGSLASTLAGGALAALVVLRTHGAALGPKTRAAAAKEPALFGGFAAALALRIAYAVVARAA